MKFTFQPCFTIYIPGSGFICASDVTNSLKYMYLHIILQNLVKNMRELFVWISMTIILSIFWEFILVNNIIGNRGMIHKRSIGDIIIDVSILHMHQL